MHRIFPNAQNRMSASFVLYSKNGIVQIDGRAADASETCNKLQSQWDFPLYNGPGIISQAKGGAWANDTVPLIQELNIATRWRAIGIFMVGSYVERRGFCCL